MPIDDIEERDGILRIKKNGKWSDVPRRTTTAEEFNKAAEEYQRDRKPAPMKKRKRPCGAC